MANSNYNTFLHFVVPYEERETAKANGLHWRTDTKTWYLPLTQREINDEAFRPVCEKWRLKFIGGGNHEARFYDELEDKCKDIFYETKKQNDQLIQEYEKRRNDIRQELRIQGLINI